jgi:hypothetical protein
LPIFATSPKFIPEQAPHHMAIIWKDNKMKITNFIGAVLAGSIAITSIFAAPVAASSRNGDLAKVLLGAAAIGLVAYSVKKNKKRRNNVAKQDYYRPQPYRQRARHYNYKPKTCLRKRYTNHGWKTFYSQRCLANHRNNRNGGYAQRHDRYDGYNNNRNTQYTDSGRYYKHKHRSEK